MSSGVVCFLCKFYIFKTCMPNKNIFHFCESNFIFSLKACSLEEAILLTLFLCLDSKAKKGAIYKLHSLILEIPWPPPPVIPESRESWNKNTIIWMSPVSPVFHTVATKSALVVLSISNWHPLHRCYLSPKNKGTLCKDISLLLFLF